MDLSANSNNNAVIVQAIIDSNCFNFDGGSDLDDDDSKMFEFDHKKMLLKKNLSWTHSSSNSHQSTSNNNNLNNNYINANAKMCSNLKNSLSNPLVLDGVVTKTTRSGKFASKLKLATSQLFPHSFPAPLQSQSNENCNKVATNAKAISTTSTFTAATTHHIATTPSAIQVTTPQNHLFYYCQVIFNHCKVNKNKTNKTKPESI